MQKRLKNTDLGSKVLVKITNQTPGPTIQFCGNRTILLRLFTDTTRRSNREIQSCVEYVDQVEV